MRRLAGLVLAAMMAPGAATAQSPGPSPAVEQCIVVRSTTPAISSEALIELLLSGAARIASVAPCPVDGASAGNVIEEGVPFVVTTDRGETVQVTLNRHRFTAKRQAGEKPPRGKAFYLFDVTYEATSGSATTSATDWMAYADGVAVEAYGPVVTPYLDSVMLSPGRKAQGWVVFAGPARSGTTVELEFRAVEAGPPPVFSVTIP